MNEYSMGYFIIQFVKQRYIQQSLQGPNESKSKHQYLGFDILQTIYIGSIRISIDVITFSIIRRLRSCILWLETDIDRLTWEIDIQIWTKFELIKQLNYDPTPKQNTFIQKINNPRLHHHHYFHIALEPIELEIRYREKYTDYWTILRTKESHITLASKMNSHRPMIYTKSGNKLNSNSLELT